jgi:hypothetical protein
MRLPFRFAEASRNAPSSKSFPIFRIFAATRFSTIIIAALRLGRSCVVFVRNRIHAGTGKDQKCANIS